MSVKFQREGVVHVSVYDRKTTYSIWVYCENDEPMFASHDMRSVPGNTPVTCIACLGHTAGGVPHKEP